MAAARLPAGSVGLRSSGHARVAGHDRTVVPYRRRGTSVLMAQRKPGETWRCEACGAALIGARTKAGKCAPIEYQPDQHGNTLLFRADDGVLSSAVVGIATISDWLRGQGVPLRLNHFASCPQAARFRPKQAV